MPRRALALGEMPPPGPQVANLVRLWDVFLRITQAARNSSRMLALRGMRTDVTMSRNEHVPTPTRFC